MTTTAIVNLIAQLIAGLAPVVSGLLAGGLTPEQARAEALVALDALLADLGGLRARLAADDAAVLREVIDAVPPAALEADDEAVVMSPGDLSDS